MHNLMNHEALGHPRLKMLVTIVNRPDADKVVRFLHDRRFHFQFTVMAQGTVGAELIELLGLGNSDKTIVACVSPGSHVESSLIDLAQVMSLRSAGKGIAFTIPLQGISLPKHGMLSKEAQAHLNENLEHEVDNMSESITHSVIVALVNQGNSEEVVSLAKRLGATGGTVVNARRTGIADAVNFLGLPIQEEKELVAILVSREILKPITDALNTSFGLDTPAHGMILSLPVDSVVGLRV